MKQTTRLLYNSDSGHPKAPAVSYRQRGHGTWGFALRVCTSGRAQDLQYLQLEVRRNVKEPDVRELTPLLPFLGFSRSKLSGVGQTPAWLAKIFGCSTHIFMRFHLQNTMHSHPQNDPQTLVASTTILLGYTPWSLRHLLLARVN